MSILTKKCSCRNIGGFHIKSYKKGLLHRTLLHLPLKYESYSSTRDLATGRNVRPRRRRLPSESALKRPLCTWHVVPLVAVRLGDQGEVEEGAPLLRPDFPTVSSVTRDLLFEEEASGTGGAHRPAGGRRLRPQERARGGGADN